MAIAANSGGEIRHRIPLIPNFLHYFYEKNKHDGSYQQLLTGCLSLVSPPLPNYISCLTEQFFKHRRL
jgi:hypothetical protein